MKFLRSTVLREPQERRKLERASLEKTLESEIHPRGREQLQLLDHVKKTWQNKDTEKVIRITIFKQQTSMGQSKMSGLFKTEEADRWWEIEEGRSRDGGTNFS